MAAIVFNPSGTITKNGIAVVATGPRQSMTNSRYHADPTTELNMVYGDRLRDLHFYENGRELAKD